MKAISLWQPWASLMAAGYKRVETRSWYPSSLRQGELVAIHAAKRWKRDEIEALLDDGPFFRRYLTLAWRRALIEGLDDMPRGAVVAIARFDYAVRTEHTNHLSFKASLPPERQAQIRLWLSDTERAFGDYRPGRWGWVFSEVRPLRPIPTQGMQGIFRWTPPDNLAARYLEPISAASDAQETLLQRGVRQLSLQYDPAEGERLADLGTEAALYGHVGMPWADRAERWLAARREPFTSEQIVADLGLPAGEVGKDRNNAVGALIRKWSRAKCITRTGYQKANRVESHGALLAVWEPSSAGQKGAA